MAVNTEDVRKVLALAGLPRDRLKIYERKLREAGLYPGSAAGGGGVGRAQVELSQALRLFLSVLAGDTPGKKLAEAVACYAGLPVRSAHYTSFGLPLRVDPSVLGLGSYASLTFGELLETLVTEARGPLPLVVGVSHVEPEHLEAFVDVTQPTAGGLPLACSLVAASADLVGPLYPLHRRRLVGGHVLTALRSLYATPAQEVSNCARVSEHAEEARAVQEDRGPRETREVGAEARRLNGAGDHRARGVLARPAALRSAAGADLSG
jgi:hypothetical protein